MTKRDDRRTDPQEILRHSASHDRKTRHKRRPCGSNTPSTPTNLAFTWSRAERHRHRTISVTLSWDEVVTNTAGAAAKMDRYFVQFDHSLDGATSTGDIQKATVEAKDNDTNSTASQYIRHVRKHSFYRYRVRAKSTEGCLSAWSSWTAWTLAADHTPPPAPQNVKVYTNATNRIVIDWDPPITYLPMEGLASITSATASVVGVGTFFQTQVGPGDVIKLDSELFTVLSITDDTHLTVTANAASTHTSVIPFSEEPDPDVAWYDVYIDTGSGFAPPAYKRDRYVHATKKSYKVNDADEGTVFYARVRSVDASGNKSNWIPGTYAGNNSPGATPDGIGIGAGGGGFIVATWQHPSRARTRRYPERWENLTSSPLKYKRARATCGHHSKATHPGDDCPTGSAMNIQLYRLTNLCGLLNTGCDSSQTSILVDESVTPPGTPFVILVEDEQMNVTARAGASNPRTYTVTRGYNSTTAAAHGVATRVLADPFDTKTDFEPAEAALFSADSKLHIDAGTHKDAKWLSDFDGAAGTQLESGDWIEVEIKQVGSNFPGAHWSVQLFMEP